jgi:hypothetical protein
LGSLQTHPKCRISLFQRTFLTVPYLGKGPFNPDLESQLSEPTNTETSEVEEAPVAELPEEEGGEYQGQILLNQLANELGTEVDTDGSINYEGKKINFFSETEKFHVDGKKFSTAEEVVNYLGGSNEAPEHTHAHEHEEEPSFDETEGDLARRDLEAETGSFESKSYKHTRKFESFRKNK